MLELPVVEEKRYHVIVNGKEIGVVYCTPEALEELSIGYLFSQKIIDSYSVISSIKIFATLQSSLAAIPWMGSGCIRIETVAPFDNTVTNAGDKILDNPNKGSLDLPLSELVAQAEKMFDSAKKYKVTGGIHCARLVSYDETGRDSASVFFEDVGRHNALDKVIGWGLINQIDFSRCAVFTSGRIAYDMLNKVLRAGIPIFVSRSIPTTLSLELAQKSNITLVGRIQSPQPLVYSGENRILSAAKIGNV